MKQVARTTAWWLMALLVLGAGVVSSAVPAAEPQPAQESSAAAWPPIDPAARLTVLYWPSVAECSGCQFTVRAALEELAKEDGEIAVVTVAPAEPGLMRDEVIAAQHFPGRLLWLSPEDYAARAPAAPLPRLEAWSRSGLPLVARSLACTVGEGRRVREELEIAKGFTAPAGDP